jgi:dihydrodipicolinate reductase
MKVTLVGSQGKMGSLIKELLQKDQHVELIYAVDQKVRITNNYLMFLNRMC